MNIKKFFHLLCGLIIFAVSSVVHVMNHKSKIEIKVMHSEVPDVFQVYVGRESRDFWEKEVINLEKVPNESIYLGVFESRIFDRVNSLRVDPTKAIGDYSLSYIELNGSSGTKVFRGMLLGDLPSNDVLVRQLNDQKLIYTASGADPYLVLNVSDYIRAESINSIAKIIFGYAISTSFLMFMLLTVMPLSRPWFRRAKSKLFDKVLKVSISISDSRFIIFKPSLVIIFVLLLITAAIFISLKLHQSSIGVWDGMFGETIQEYSVNLGTPKRIRSDEWNTQTPWILNQSQLDFEVNNSNIGGANSALIAYTPTLFWTSILQPKFWGLYLFDLERGFSWIWAYKLFGLIASFLLLFSIVARGSVILALIGTTWVVGSSFVQWWFSSGAPEILIGFAFSVTGAIYMLIAQRRGLIIAGGVLLAFGLSTLLFHAYPAFAIPLAYLGLVTVIGVFVSASGPELFVNMWRMRCFVGAACALFFVSLFLIWYAHALDVIHLMAQTVYPGHRFNLGGTISLDRVWYGFFESLRIGEDEIPLPPSNASEASGFLMIFPALLFFLRPASLFIRANRLSLYLLIFCVAVMAWIALPLPDFLRYVVSSLGWGKSSSERALVALGIGSILLTVSIVSSFENDKKSFSWFYDIIVLLLVVCGLILFGFHLSHVDQIFFTPVRIFFGVLVSVLLLISLRTQRFFLALIFIFTASIPSLSVNPLQSGLASILDKPILNVAKSSSGIGDRWLVVGSFVFAQGLKARGLDVINGSSFAPDVDKMSILDPGNVYSSVWNRYAHISVTSDPSVQDPIFVLLGGDHFMIKINLCNKDLLERLKVTRVAYTVTPPIEDTECLRSVISDVNSGVSIFSTKDDVQNTVDAGR